MVNHHSATLQHLAKRDQPPLTSGPAPPYNALMMGVRGKHSMSISEEDTSRLETTSSAEQYRKAAAVFGLMIVVTVVALRAMGRPWWCGCGHWFPVSVVIQSRHNSQHLFDIYSVTHVLHGIGFFGILWLLFRTRLSTFDRALLALGMECLWEVGENTNLMIERYRNMTFALGYYGDSIGNSLGDIAACGAGYLLAASIPLWGSVVTWAGIEMILLCTIRDGLFLNILMLVWPVESIRRWQGGG
jgi:hypothetical protein